MDTHTGHVWSRSFELKETAGTKDFNPVTGEIKTFPNKIIAKRE